MHRRKFKQILLPLSFFLTLIVIFYFVDLKKRDKALSLKKHYLYNFGEVVSVVPGGKTPGYAVFEYSIHDKVFSGNYFPGSREFLKYFWRFYKYQWPIIYDSTDVSNAALLLQKSDYDKFGIPYTGGRIVDFEKMEIVDSIQTIPLR